MMFSTSLPRLAVAPNAAPVKVATSTVGVLLATGKASPGAPAGAHVLVPVKPTPATSGTALVLAAQGMASAHGLAQASSGGDPTAQQTVLDVVGAARAGDPGAIAAADALSMAQKLQIQSKYVAKWRGPNAALQVLRGAHMGLPQFAV